MAYLVRPNIRYQTSYLAALDEYGKDSSGVGPPSFLLSDKAVFEKYLEDIFAQADSPRSPGTDHAPFLMWWWVEGDKYLGRISLRLHLTEKLELYGGHVGYDIRPTERSKGYGSAMFSSLLPIAKALGFTELLMICEEENISSRAIIEKNGGRFYDAVTDENRCLHLRFFVDLN